MIEIYLTPLCCCCLSWHGLAVSFQFGWPLFLNQVVQMVLCLLNWFGLSNADHQLGSLLTWNSVVDTIMLSDNVLKHLNFVSQQGCFFSWKHLWRVRFWSPCLFITEFRFICITKIPMSKDFFLILSSLLCFITFNRVGKYSG